MPYARVVKLRKEGSPHRFIALHSLLSSHFEFLPDKHKNDYIVRFRCKHPFFLFFTTCHISLFQVDLASLWTCWTETRSHAEHLYERHRLLVGGVLGRGSALCRRLPLFFWFCLLNSTENSRVVVRRPRKKSPTHSDVFWWLTSWRPDKAGRSPVRLWNARPRFFLTWTFSLPLLPDLSSHLTYSLLFYFSYMERVFVSFTVTWSIFLLLETPRPGFSPRWGIH